MGRLTTCRDCGHRVSKSADFCPSCGARFRLRFYEGRWSTVFKGVLFCFAFLLLLMLLSLMSPGA